MADIFIPYHVGQSVQEEVAKIDDNEIMTKNMGYFRQS